MNKHSIIYIICLFVLASCKHEITLTHETCRTYKNLLKNKIICVQETELGCKSFSKQLRYGTVITVLDIMVKVYELQVKFPGKRFPQRCLSCSHKPDK